MIRQGLAIVLPIDELSLLSADELDAKICGSCDISFEQLKKVIDCSLDSDHARMFWEVLEHDLTPSDRSNFLQYATGYRRLPPDPTAFRPRVRVSLLSLSLFLSLSVSLSLSLSFFLSLSLPIQFPMGSCSFVSVPLVVWISTVCVYLYESVSTSSVFL